MSEHNMLLVKAGISAFFAALTALWGWFGWLVVLWALLMAVDFATGVGAALHAGEWDSSVARKGIWHKAGCIAAVLVAGALDIVIEIILREIPFISLPFTYTVLLCPIVLVWYILTELGSIVENAGKMGAPLPSILKKAIAALKSGVEKAGDKIGEDVEEG